MPQPRLTACLILGMAAALFFVGIDAPLLEPQEGRYAEIPREMLERNDWVVPSFNSQPYLDKPPLLYWYTMLGYRLFGVADSSARLTASLAAFGSIVVLFFWGRQVGGNALGGTAAGILALTGVFVYRGRWLSFDTLLCFWITLSLATAHLAATSHRFRGWFLLSALAAGLAFLTKGLVVFVLVGVPIAAGRWIVPCMSAFTVRRCFLWGILACAVASPWFLAMLGPEPTFLSYFFYKHHFERYVHAFDHQKPFWFYIPELLAGLFPWILLFPACLRWSARAVASDSNQQNLRETAQFCGLTAIGCVLFFSLSSSKRATYILPCYPPLALALACYIQAQFSASIKRRLIACAGVIWLGMLGAVGVGWPEYTGRFSLREVLAPVRESHHQKEPIFCYPRLWDSIPFYTLDSNIHVYGNGAIAELIQDLQAQPRAWLIVKPALLPEILEAIPPTLIAQERSRNHEIVVLQIEQKAMLRSDQ